MKVLIAVDGTKGSRSVLSVFRAMAQEPESAVLLQVQRSEGKSIIDSPGRRGSGLPGRAPAGSRTPDRSPQTVINFYKRALESAGPVKVAVLTRHGNPSDEILRAAEEESVDLIIMGGRGSLLRPGGGRVAGEVERNATVPVLVPKTNRFKKFIMYNWRGKEYAA